MRTLNQETLKRTEEFITEYQKANNRSPKYREIMHGLGMSSLNLVQLYVLALEREGKIKRTPKGSIALPERYDVDKTTVAPLVGRIICGQPAFAEENIEGRYALPSDIFGNGELFILHAYGDSMTGAGINDGDYVVLRKQNTAENGEIVSALIDGEATLKRFYRKDGKIILHPENSTMEDIIVKECEIQGVLVSCIKKY